MVFPKGHEISVVRIHRGLSMRQLAKKTGLNIGTISNIEGKSLPVRPQTAKRICEVLTADFDDIFVISERKDA